MSRLASRDGGCCLRMEGGRGWRGEEDEGGMREGGKDEG